MVKSIFQRNNILWCFLIWCQSQIMKCRYDTWESFISNSPPYKCNTIFHSKVFLKTQAISIWICLQFHWAREIIPDLKLFQAFIYFNYFIIFLENCFIPRSFDSSSWIPAKLITQRIIISLLSNWKTSAITFITKNFISFLICLMNYFHCSHNVNTGIKSTFIQKY